MPVRNETLAGATIVFDLDGTLVDTAPDLIGSLNVVLAEQGLPALPTEAARILVGRGARILIERGFLAAGRSLDDDRKAGLVSRFIEIYRSRIASESRPFDGVERALDALAARGAKLSVCTNKPTDLSVLLLETLGMKDRFRLDRRRRRRPGAQARSRPSSLRHRRGGRRCSVRPDGRRQRGGLRGRPCGWSAGRPGALRL